MRDYQLLQKGTSVIMHYTSAYIRGARVRPCTLATCALYRMAAREELGLELFSRWFQTLNTIERRWFLDRLVAVALPHKLFAQVERAALVSPRTLPTTWGECRDFEERALFCVARIQSWSVAQANAFVNELEAIDQDTVYEFYERIASAIKEP